MTWGGAPFTLARLRGNVLPSQALTMRGWKWTLNHSQDPGRGSALVPTSRSSGTPLADPSEKAGRSSGAQSSSCFGGGGIRGRQADLVDALGVLTPGVLNLSRLSVPKLSSIYERVQDDATRVAGRHAYLKNDSPPPHSSPLPLPLPFSPKKLNE